MISASGVRRCSYPCLLLAYTSAGGAAIPAWQDDIWRTQRVSEFYDLGLDQASLEFVDVDIVADTRLYIDPRALRLLAEENDWARECVLLLQDYFGAVLRAVTKDHRTEGLRLLRGLREPNDTRLGMSRRQAQGKGVGRGLAAAIWDSLRASEAAKSGLLEDLEDTALVIDGVATDRISDITTNVIRGPLIAFTQDMCEAHPQIVTEEVTTGLIWDSDSHDWITDQREELPTPRGRPLVLVPKSVLRTKLDFDPREYYSYVIGWLRDWELSRPNSDLIYLLKGGRKNVTKKSVAAKYRRKYGQSIKQVNSEATLEHPEILSQFRADMESPLRRRPPPTHREIAERTQGEPPDWRQLLRDVVEVQRGKAGANAYHRAVAKLFHALFWPELQFGELEVKTHRGHKRLDIRYVNVIGGDGFFSWLAANFGNAPFVTVECKNYSADPANPELDQLVGRFTSHNGKVGILACRRFKNKKLFVDRCRETAKNGQGFVLPIDDDDIRELVAARQADDGQRFDQFFYDRFHEITD